MKSYLELSKEELLQEKASLESEYAKIKDLGLSLDMSRGKPGNDQLEISNDECHSFRNRVCQ